MIYEHVNSKDSNLQVEKEVTVHIRYLDITGNSIGLSTAIDNRDEIAKEVALMIRYCNEREMSRNMAAEMCIAVMRSMIAECNAPDRKIPLDTVYEYLDIIFGKRENADLYKTDANRDNT